jgi:nitrite reductase/ring-hydroxylating ferredoxin subunit
MSTISTQEEKIKRGAEDSWTYFKYMTEFVGFTEEDAQAIHDSGLIIEKHLPHIVAEFYAHILRYPPTRKFFLKKDGSIDQEYTQLRMHHLTNFWRRTANGKYDEDYARYIDYVGRAHTSYGADPKIYIAERYVIGQVGFIQHAITKALVEELHDYDPDLENRAVLAWNKMMMVILEMLSRAYGHERDSMDYQDLIAVDHPAVQQMAVDTYERGLGLARSREYLDFRVGTLAEIPEGERKIVRVDGLSIGVFHHNGAWYALRNSCLHRGGPVATGTLDGDTLTCPWHGFEYNVTNGALLEDENIKLEMFPVTIQGNDVLIRVPVSAPEPAEQAAQPAAGPVRPKLKANEFYASDLASGHARLVYVDGLPVAVFNVGGSFFATQEACTHAAGPLSEGTLEGQHIICPLHGSCFDVTDGSVCGGPARQPVKTFSVSQDGEVARVGAKVAA